MKGFQVASIPIHLHETQFFVSFVTSQNTKQNIQSIFFLSSLKWKNKKQTTTGKLDYTSQVHPMADAMNELFVMDFFSVKINVYYSQEFLFIHPFSFRR